MTEELPNETKDAISGRPWLEYKLTTMAPASSSGDCFDLLHLWNRPDTDEQAIEHGRAQHSICGHFPKSCDLGILALRVLVDTRYISGFS